MVAVLGEGVLYRGADRRAVGEVATVNGRRVACCAAAAGAALTFVSIVLVLVMPHNTQFLRPFALALWCMATLASGLVLLGAWKIGGRSLPARFGVGLVLAAVLIPVIGLSLDEFVPRSQLRSATAVVLAVVLAAAGSEMARSTRSAEVDTGLRPLRRLALLAGVTVTGAAGALILSLLLVPRSGATVRFLPAVVCIVYAAWAYGVASRAREAGPVARAIPASLTLFALAVAVHQLTASFFGTLLVATAFAASGGVLIGLAGELLRIALLSQNVRSLTTIASLAQYETAAQRERERRHDALSALSAIRSASNALASNGEELDPDTRLDLAAAVRAELSRVERMLALTTPPVDRSAEVDVATALRPVLIAWREKGLAIEEPAEGFRTQADPDVLIRIVNNLLHNVHRHASGATVRMLLDETDDAVHLSVIDTGPGIPAQRRATIFESGVCLNPATGGEGLGLPSARRLAHSQHGELRLLDLDDGCWFVVSLPRAHATDRQPNAAPGHSA